VKEVAKRASNSKCSHRRSRSYRIQPKHCLVAVRHYVEARRLWVIVMNSKVRREVCRKERVYLCLKGEPDYTYCHCRDCQDSKRPPHIWTYLVKMMPFLLHLHKVLARLAKEGHPHHPKRVERGHDGNQHRHDKQRKVIGIA